MSLVTRVFTQKPKPKTSTQQIQIKEVKSVSRALDKSQSVDCILVKFEIVSGDFEGFNADIWLKPTHPKASIAELEIDRLLKILEAFNVNSGRPADLEGCEAQVHLEVRKGKCCEFYSISSLAQEGVIDDNAED